MDQLTEQVPRLVQRFSDAHTSDEVPSFRWDNASLIYFQQSDQDSVLHYQVYTFSPSGVKNLTGRYEKFTKSIYQSCYLDRTSKIQANALPKEELLPSWSSEQALSLVPIGLLTAPVAILVIPLLSQEEEQRFYNDQFPFLSGLVRNCLIEDIISEFDNEQLYLFDSDKALLVKFTALIARWLCPTTYQHIYKEQEESLFQPIEYRGEFGKSQWSCELNLTIGTRTCLVQFELPSFLLPFKETKELYHKDEQLKFRWLKYQWEIEKQFTFLYRNWIELKTTRYQLARRIQQQLEQYRTFFDGLLKDLSLSTVEGSGATARPSEAAPFCFYRINNHWVVRFDGKDIRHSIKSRKGMEAIRLLIEFEAIHLSPTELDELLDIQGVNYKRSSEKTSDPNLDKIQLQELQEELRTYRGLEIDIYNKSIHERVAYWRLRFQLANALITYLPITQYFLDRKKAQNALNKLTVQQDFDENFMDFTSDIFKPNRKTGNEKNRKDGIKKAIDAVLNEMEPFPEIHRYLKTTIVTTNRGSFRPFIYYPSLYQGENLSSIPWITAPPDS